MAKRFIIDDATGALYDDFTARRVVTAGDILEAEGGASETIQVFLVNVNPQTRAVATTAIATANVSLDIGNPGTSPTGGKVIVSYGGESTAELPVASLNADSLGAALNRLDAVESDGGADVWAAGDPEELKFYIRLQNTGAPGTSPSVDTDGATPPAAAEVSQVTAGASSERALWLLQIAEKPVASIAESAWSTVTTGSFGGLTASLALNGAGLLAHLAKPNPPTLAITVKNSDSVIMRGKLPAFPAIDPTDLNGSAILSIFPRIVTSTSDPTTGDDSGDGYAVGTLWVNTSADTYFVLADSTAGAAVWVSHLHLTGGTMTGAIAMGSNKITGLADGTASADAINKGQLDGLIDDAPEALDTLNELAAALGDDVNFSTTVATTIATKLPLAGGTMTGALNTLDINLTDSDVAHGITNVAATDAYGHLSTIHGTQGGLYINGISDQESADARSLALRGICNDTHTDTVPTVEIIGAKRSGTTVQALADAETVLTVANHTTDLLTVLGSGDLTTTGDFILPEDGIIRHPNGADRGYIKMGTWTLDLRYGAVSALTVSSGIIVNNNGSDRDFLIHTTIGNTFFAEGSSGRVGINNNSPSSNLDVRGAAGYPGILTLSTAETTVEASNQLGRIDFVAPLESSGTDAILVGASITALAVSDFTSISNTTDLIFSTAISDTATEKMRLTSAGQLAIGVSSVAYAGTKLEVAGAIQATMLSNRGGNFWLAGDDGGTAGNGLDIKYFNGTAWLDALTIDNVGSGYGDLLLMQAGGKVEIGGSLAVAGAKFATGVRTISSDVSLLASDFMILVATGGGPRKIQIPDDQCVAGRYFYIKDHDGAANSYAISVWTATDQTIDGTDRDTGSALTVINTAWGSCMLYCESASAWHVLGMNDMA